MTLSTYQTGTATVSVGGTTVTGSGTIWTGGNAREGDVIVIGDASAMVLAVVSATELTITPWPGSAETDASYTIYQTSPRRFDSVEVADDLRKQVAALNTTGFYHFVPTSASAPDPSLGDEGQYAFQAVTGKLWLKENGAWNFVGVYKALSAKGEWDAEADYIAGDVVSRGGRLWFCIQAGSGHVPESSPDYWTLFLAGGDRYDLASFDTDRPATGELLVKIYPLGVTFPAGLTESQAGAEVAASADAVFSITKNGVEFATLTFPAASAEGVFACATDTTFESGDVLRVIAPNPRDATLSGVAATLVGFR